MKATESFTSVLGTDSIHILDLKVHERLGSFDIRDVSGQEEICEEETITYLPIVVFRTNGKPEKTFIFLFRSTEIDKSNLYFNH
ncbi:MAG: hypothetical protein ABFS38_22250 [Bacteroidota bacterium]